MDLREEVEQVVDEALDEMASRLHDKALRVDDLGAHDSKMWARIRGVLATSRTKLVGDAQAILIEERED